MTFWILFYSLLRALISRWFCPSDSQIVWLYFTYCKMYSMFRMYYVVIFQMFFSGADEQQCTYCTGTYTYSCSCSIVTSRNRKENGHSEGEGEGVSSASNVPKNYETFTLMGFTKICLCATGQQQLAIVILLRQICESQYIYSERLLRLYTITKWVSFCTSEVLVIRK